MALCSADPFPVIKIGSGENDHVSKRVRCIEQRDKAIEKDLNPKFYQAFELDASLPEDWRLEITIKDKGYTRYQDEEIGSTVIDLEQRRYGLKYN